MPEAGAAKAKQRQRKLRRAAGAAEGEGGDDSSRRVTRAQILASHLQRLLAAGWGLVVVTLLGPATSLQRNYLRRHMLPPLAGLLVLLFAAVLAGTAQTASGLEDLVGVGAGGVLPRCGAADASGRLPGGSSLGLLLQLLAGPASACRLSDFPLTETQAKPVRILRLPLLHVPMPEGWLAVHVMDILLVLAGVRLAVHLLDNRSGHPLSIGVALAAALWPLGLPAMSLHIALHLLMAAAEELLVAAPLIRHSFSPKPKIIAGTGKGGKSSTLTITKPAPSHGEILASVVTSAISPGLSATGAGKDSQPPENEESEKPAEEEEEEPEEEEEEEEEEEAPPPVPEVSEAELRARRLNRERQLAEHARKKAAAQAEARARAEQRTRDLMRQRAAKKRKQQEEFRRANEREERRQEAMLARLEGEERAEAERQARLALEQREFAEKIRRSQPSSFANHSYPAEVPRLLRCAVTGMLLQHIKVRPDGRCLPTAVARILDPKLNSVERDGNGYPMRAWDEECEEKAQTSVREEVKQILLENAENRDLNDFYTPEMIAAEAVAFGDDPRAWGTDLHVYAMSHILERPVQVWRYKNGADNVDIEPVYGECPFGIHVYGIGQYKSPMNWAHLLYSRKHDHVDELDAEDGVEAAGHYDFLLPFAEERRG